MFVDVEFIREAGQEFFDYNPAFVDESSFDNYGDTVLQLDVTFTNP